MNVYFISAINFNVSSSSSRCEKNCSPFQYLRKIIVGINYCLLFRPPPDPFKYFGVVFLGTSYDQFFESISTFVHCRRFCDLNVVRDAKWRPMKLVYCTEFTALWPWSVTSFRDRALMAVTWCVAVISLWFVGRLAVWTENISRLVWNIVVNLAHLFERFTQQPFFAVCKRWITM